MTTVTTQNSYMKTSEGMVVPLTSTIVNASMHDLLADVTMTQVYKNTESKNIEAVYTFPLPIDAVLLDVDVRLEDRNLKGCIVEKGKAETQYEEAIVDGNTAIMLQQVETGLYTMNVGNLQAGKTVRISVQYSVLHRWQGDQLRFYLPTTVAPRYGVPEMEMHQVPVADISIENSFSFSLKISGLLKNAIFDSPSHKVVCEESDDHIVIHLNDEMAMMNRDLIINIRNRSKENVSAVYDRDIDGYVSLLSFKPEFGSQEIDSPHAITIVVDCSGSMAGDSISQAKGALQRIIDELRPCDSFNIILFGSSHKTLFRKMAIADPLATGKAKLFVNEMSANMGGTEIGDALHAAYRLQGKNELPQDILLITDGEVWNTDTIVSEAKKSSQRIFSVGVGSSVSESFVQEIARITGGACELVSPNEDMAERIYRHARRMYGKRSKDVVITWPDKNSTQTPVQLNSIFDGDTVHVFSRSQSKPEGNVAIQVLLQNDESWSYSLPLIHMPDINKHQLSTLCRIAADASLGELEQQQATEKALTYQLMSEWTNFLVVDQMPYGEDAQDLPELRQVPHMLAAGWGGAGDAISFSIKERSTSYAQSGSDNNDCFSAPTFLRRSSDTLVQDTPRDFLSEVDKNLKQLGDIQQLTLDDLFDMDVPEDVIDLLQDIIDQGFDEGPVVLCFMELVINKAGGALRFLRRKVTRAIMGLRVDHQLMQQMQITFSGLNKHRWAR